MSIDAKNRNISYPAKIPENNTKQTRKHYCDICAEGGCSGIPIRWKKRNGKWIPFEYDYPDEPHSHHNAEEERLDWEFENVRGR